MTMHVATETVLDRTMRMIFENQVKYVQKIGDGYSRERVRLRDRLTQTLPQERSKNNADIQACQEMISRAQYEYCHETSVMGGIWSMQDATDVDVQYEANNSYLLNQLFTLNARAKELVIEQETDTRALERLTNQVYEFQKKQRMLKNDLFIYNEALIGLQMLTRLLKSSFALDPTKYQLVLSQLTVVHDEVGIKVDVSDDFAAEYRIKISTQVEHQWSEFVRARAAVEKMRRKYLSPDVFKSTRVVEWATTLLHSNTRSEMSK